MGISKGTFDEQPIERRAEQDRGGCLLPGWRRTPPQGVRPVSASRFHHDGAKLSALGWLPPGRSVLPRQGPSQPARRPGLRTVQLRRLPSGERPRGSAGEFRTHGQRRHDQDLRALDRQGRQSHLDLGRLLRTAGAARQARHRARPQKLRSHMAVYTHQTAPTRYVETTGFRFAYRRFGKRGGVPLVFNQHFRGTMDYWDPAVTDGLAKSREVILFNNAGISSSSGQAPTTVQ